MAKKYGKRQAYKKPVPVVRKSTYNKAKKENKSLKTKMNVMGFVMLVITVVGGIFGYKKMKK